MQFVRNWNQATKEGKTNQMYSRNQFKLCEESNTVEVPENITAQVA